MKSLPAQPREYVIVSDSGTFEEFEFEEKDPLGYFDMTVTEKIFEDMLTTKEMDPARRVLHEVSKQVPYSIYKELIKDITVYLDSDKNRQKGYKIVYRKNSSISYLKALDGDEIKLHPYDGKTS
jgi:hypothetical protein